MSDGVLSHSSLSNGLVTIEVDTASATFSMTTAEGLQASNLGRLVDDGDEGDTYNYSPPAFDSVVDWPDSCTVMIVESGPLRGSLLMTARYHWPERIDDGERIRGRDVTVETLIELRAGERFARITVELDNQCRDHRLRAWFPLPVTDDDVEGGMRVRGRHTRPRRRGGTDRGRPPDVPLAALRGGRRPHGRARGPRGVRARRHPRRRGARARAHAPASRRASVSRADGELGRCPPARSSRWRARRCSAADSGRMPVALGEVDPYALVDDAFLPMHVAVGQGRGDWTASATCCGSSGAEVSSVRRVGSALEVRVFNPTANEVQVDIGHRTGWLVDLRGLPAGRGRRDVPPRSVAHRHAQVALSPDEQRLARSGRRCSTRRRAMAPAA